jgi:hypothetical protein
MNALYKRDPSEGHRETEEGAGWQGLRAWSDWGFLLPLATPAALASRCSRTSP